MAKSKKDQKIEAAAKADMEAQAAKAQEGIQTARENKVDQAVSENSEEFGRPQEDAQASTESQNDCDVLVGTQQTNTSQEAAQPLVESLEAPSAAEGSDQIDEQRENEYIRKPVQGNVLVIYNGFVNLRRTPCMLGDNIMGQAGRGTVLNAVAEVVAEDSRWYETVGGAYILADETLIEFSGK